MQTHMEARAVFVLIWINFFDKNLQISFLTFKKKVLCIAERQGNSNSETRWTHVVFIVQNSYNL